MFFFIKTKLVKQFPSNLQKMLLTYGSKSLVNPKELQSKSMKQKSFEVKKRGKEKEKGMRQKEKESMR